MLLYTHNQLSVKKLTELKAIAKGYSLKGFSTLKKADLVKFIKSNEPSAFDCSIQYVHNDSLQSFSITHLDLNLSISSLVSIIKQHAAGKIFSNQTHNEKEIKALYRAGFRTRGNETLTEAQTLALLKDSSSIRMVANTTKYNLITEATEEAQEEQTEVIDIVAPAEAIQPVEAQQEATEETKTENIFWYAYRLRGFSPGCQPSNFIAHNENIGKHGIIGYNRKLTEQELSDYELIAHYETYQEGEEQTDTKPQQELFNPDNAIEYKTPETAWNDLKHGKSILLSYREIDALEAYINGLNDTEQDLYYKHSASLYIPSLSYGLLSRCYVLTIKNKTYCVGNRYFSNYAEAVAYCNTSDFDSELMIEY